MAGLADALKALNNAVEDLTSLHVQTFTGTMTTQIESAKSFKEVKTLIETEKNNKTDATIELVAETYAQFDGDSYNFVKKDLENVPSLALETHKNAVAAGIETRMGLLKLFKDLIK